MKIQEMNLKIIGLRKISNGEKINTNQIDKNAITVKNMVTGQANVQKIKQIYPTDKKLINYLLTILN